MTKRAPSFPARMPEASKHAASSSIACADGVIAGASAKGFTLDSITSTVSHEPLRVVDAVEVITGRQAMGGGHPAPPRGGQIGGGGPEEFSRPDIRASSSFMLTLPVSPPLTPPLGRVQFPMRTERGQNAREHWRDRARRVKDEKWSTGWSLLGAFGPRNPWPLPLVVTLTRGAPSGGLDDDNLSGSFKAIRDAVADWLGVDDKRSDLVRYRYAQERVKREWFVRIEFQPMATGQVAATQEHTA